MEVECPYCKHILALLHSREVEFDRKLKEAYQKVEAYRYELERRDEAQRLP